MNDSSFAKLNILYIDHLAVTTANFEQALTDYLSLPGTRLIKGPAINQEQRVQYAFIQLQAGWLIELLAPQAGSPIQHHVERGGGPYHFCYAVADLQGAIAQAQATGAKVVVEPIPDVAFDGRCVAFLVDATHGLFELVEAFPSLGTYSQSLPTAQPFSRPPLPPPTPRAMASLPTPHGLEQRLTTVFQKVFTNLASADVLQAQMSELDAWTSLRHLQLIMEVEAEFELDISPHYLSDLISFSAFLEYLKKHPSGFSG